MKIVVTGGTGFLGQHVVRRLATGGHDVVFCGRNRDLAERVQAGLGGQARFVAVEHGTVAGERALLDCTRGADALVHCAALASPWGAAEVYRRSNIDAVREVLRACADHAVGKLVHISSPSIYFTYADRLLIQEDAPLPPPVNDYARTKSIGEDLVLAAGRRHAIILRPRAIFGPGDNALLPRLLRLARRGRVPLPHQGRALIDLTYVDNVVDAIEAALALDGNPHGMAPVFNISNGQPLAVRELFARIGASFDLPLKLVRCPYGLADFAARVLEAGARFAPGWEPPLTRYTLGAIAYSQTLDLSRARAVLGYQPRVSVDEGLRRTAQWWRQSQAEQR